MSIAKDAKIYVAGHSGLAGAALVRHLKAQGYNNLLTRTHRELDLVDGSAVAAFFDSERPDYVFDAAGKVGGIKANSDYPADFIRENILMRMNLIDSAWRSRVKKSLFLGSSCIYPKFAPQPLIEDDLLTGPLEPTNEWYAIAKISGIKVCQAYRKQFGFAAINPMPTNLYGPGDNFNPETSHVVPALIHKFHEAKVEDRERVEVWGTGTPKREFLFVDDLADACLFLMNHYDDGEIINVGTGEDVSIAELARVVQDVVEFEGKLEFDTSKPDGTPRKLLDVSRISEIGWRSKVPLRDGIERTYRWFVSHQSDFRA